MHVLAFAATNHRQSINRALVGFAAQRLVELNPNAQVTFLDLNDYEMPIYSVERQDTAGIPDAAQKFFEAIGRADAVLVSFAEHTVLSRRRGRTSLIG